MTRPMQSVVSSFDPWSFFTRPSSSAPQAQPATPAPAAVTSSTFYETVHALAVVMLVFGGSIFRPLTIKPTVGIVAAALSTMIVSYLTFFSEMAWPWLLQAFNLARSILVTAWFKGPWVFGPIVWDFCCSLFRVVLAPSPVFWILLTLYIIFSVRWYYHAYLDLGRGGTPPNAWGCWRIFRLKLVTRLFIDVFSPPRVPPLTDPYRGRLFGLPKRDGPRATVLGVAPQRQSDQKASPSTALRLNQMLQDIANEFPEQLTIDQSYLEGHLPALKRRLGADEVAGKPGTPAEFGGEIAHIHLLDGGSAHFVLSPEDVRTVIETGYGERHPLATNWFVWRWWHHYFRKQRFPVPETTCFIYAPRHQGELDAVRKIAEAAAWWATKGKAYPVTIDTYPMAPAPASA
ncbi:hypothetical protein JX265_012933 [Neoarthrinium moseri]|uniref:Luciferase domain-containing protein n=1 Tax=Neoarthrinium moseri TaxID=1658444 RepID=A0A9P9W9R3_9PEZI|nr:hypothetical protein JX266_013056 [Neoarthrinium moseri]KAI1852905.1 hypothetical protein JX265_012933 [Neoarthrinium moseri]